MGGDESPLHSGTQVDALGGGREGGGEKGKVVIAEGIIVDEARGVERTAYKRTWDADIKIV